MLHTTSYRSSPRIDHRKTIKLEPQKNNVSLYFHGNTLAPPKKPDFLKQFDDHPFPKGATGLKSAAITLGAGLSIVGFTVLCATFLPVAIAGIPIFIGVLGITTAALNWAVPTKTPEGRTPLTQEQLIEDCKYGQKLRAYNRQQQWLKLKQNLKNIFK